MILRIITAFLFLVMVVLAVIGAATVVLFLFSIQDDLRRESSKKSKINNQNKQ